MAAHNLVTIGNHAVDHIRLSMCSDHEIQFQIETAQKNIAEIIGYLPQVISYPHGAYDERILSISQQVGLSMGVTVERRYDLLPFDSDGNEIMKLGRFFFSGGERYPKDFDIYRPELQQYYKINAYKNRILKKMVN